MNRGALKFAMLSALSSALVVGSIVALGYLFTVWGERGLYIGAPRSGGYTEPGEKVLLVVSALGLPAFVALSAVCLVIFFRRRSAQ